MQFSFAFLSGHVDQDRHDGMGCQWNDYVVKRERED